jgi:hypothetical protein
MKIIIHVCKKQYIYLLCGLVVRVPDYTTEMYFVSSEVRTEFIYVMWKKVDRLCGLVVRVPDYTVEMYFVSSEVRTEFIYVMYKKVDRPCGLVVRVTGYRSRGPVSIPCPTRFSEKKWNWNGVHSAS